MEKILQMLANGEAENFKTAVGQILTDKLSNARQDLKVEVGKSMSTSTKEDQ